MRLPDFTRRVAVTGLGIVSPVGTDIPTAWDNLIRRIAPEARTLASDDPSAPSGVADHSSLLDQPTPTE